MGLGSGAGGERAGAGGAPRAGTGNGGAGCEGVGTASVGLGAATLSLGGALEPPGILSFKLGPGGGVGVVAIFKKSIYGCILCNYVR